MSIKWIFCSYELVQVTIINILVHIEFMNMEINNYTSIVIEFILSFFMHRNFILPKTIFNVIIHWKNLIYYIYPNGYFTEIHFVSFLFFN